MKTIEGKREIEMSDPRNRAEMSRRRGRKSVIPQCQGDNFLNSGPPPLTQTRKPNLTQSPEMSEHHSPISD